MFSPIRKSIFHCGISLIFNFSLIIMAFLAVITVKLFRAWFEIALIMQNRDPQSLGLKCWVGLFCVSQIWRHCLFVCLICFIFLPVPETMCPHPHSALIFSQACIQSEHPLTWTEAYLCVGWIHTEWKPM